LQDSTEIFFSKRHLHACIVSKLQLDLEVESHAGECNIVSSKKSRGGREKGCCSLMKTVQYKQQTTDANIPSLKQE
jgi:hypothetical protein